MLQRLLEQEKAVCQVLGADPKTNHLKLRWQDTEVIESIVGALKPVADFTDALAAEKQVTTSCLRPMMEHLNTEALVENEGDTTLKKDIQHKIKQYMNTKYDDDNTRELISLATILDPRFKSNYCTEEDKTTLQEKIIAEGKIVVRRIEESAAPGEITLTQASQQDEAVQAPIKKKRKLSDILDQRKTSTSTTRAKSVEQRIQDD